ncbi:hypothetical protein XENOCAPTIV_013403, partial [Xenoophorus captivus]
MEDACSEYDNVGSDVEQDYDEVLHLNSQGPINMRYCNQHSPGVVEQAEESHKDPTADQITEKSHHSTKKCERPQSDGKPYRMGHRFKSHCAPIAGDEAEGGMKIIQGDRFFYKDGDDFEEVLDGARFIEDLDETEISVQRPTSFYQGIESERIKKGAHERKREDETRIPRNHNLSGAGRKSEPSRVGPKGKERQGKSRGRGVAGDETQHSSTEQHPKTMSKKSVVRSKDWPGSSKHHHPPPAHRAQSPPDPQRTLPHREILPVSGPHPSPADNQEIESRPIKPFVAPQHTAEQQRESPEERQRGSEKPEQEGAAFPIFEDGKYSGVLLHLKSVLFKYMQQRKMSYNKVLLCLLVPGPCEPEDLIDGIIFAANYLGCTQVLSDKNPSKSVRMSQAHEAVSRIKETMMDSALRTISYIADIGSIVVLMARRRMSQASSEDFSES